MISLIPRRCIPFVVAANKTCSRKCRNSAGFFLTKFSTDSQKSSYCEVSIDNNIAVLKMKKPPVNSLNLEFITELDKTIEELENNESVKGLILTSSSPNIFSAGLDILEMYKPKQDRVVEFWKALQSFWMRLYGSNLTTVAAINGHSPAGGCLLAVSCDYRIMATGKYTIGLNETLLGIAAPYWFIDAMRNVIGQRQTEKAVQLGTLFNPDEALKVGLVDELADPSLIQENAKREITKWLKLPDKARAFSKQLLRKSEVEKLVANRDRDLQSFLHFVNDESVQKSLEYYLEALKKRSKQS